MTGLFKRNVCQSILLSRVNHFLPKLKKCLQKHAIKACLLSPNYKKRNHSFYCYMIYMLHCDFAKVEIKFNLY